ncbi:ACP S-malonyltransferase [Salibacterium sp. K-3]
MGKRAFLFPGQGSQYPGMAKAFYDNNTDAKARIEEADHILGFPLSGMMFSGPENELKKTEHAQPALLTAEMVSLDALKQHGIQADYAAGHSLGEYAALAAAGVISFENALRIVRQRGLFMEEAVPEGTGSMSAVMGLDRETVERICSDVSSAGGVVQAANLNAPGQIVISGGRESVEKAEELARQENAKRVISLEVSGPFHSRLMEPAQEKLAAALEPVPFSQPAFPVLPNVHAREETDPGLLKQHVIEQVTSPVYWEDTIRRLIELGVDTFIEVGPGNVLGGLVRRVQRRGVHVYSAQDPESVEKAAEALT